MGELFRFSVVGPRDSVELILNVGQISFPNITMIPMVYEDTFEAKNIFAPDSINVDAWLFSGIAPYSLISDSGKIHKHVFYVPHTGSSLYRVLLQAVYQDKQSIESISFDTFSYDEVKGVFLDLNGPIVFPKIRISPKEIDNPHDLSKWHYDLWKSGETKMSVTCYLRTYQELSEKGIPSYRVRPTRDAILTTIDQVIQSIERDRFKGSQISVQLVEIENFEALIGKSYSGHYAKRQDLELYGLLLDYGRSIDGSVYSRGDGRYTLYSTRGRIENYTHSLKTMPIIDLLKRNLKVPVCGGIGFGETAIEAERNANIAIQFSKNGGPGNWTFVSDDRQVIGPLASKSAIKFSIRTTNPLDLAWAERLHVGTTTIQRLWYVLDRLKGKPILAEDFATLLNINQRSASRILNRLVEINIANVVGKQSKARGRPSRLFLIDIEKFR